MTHASSDLHWESSQVVPPYLSIIRFFYTYPHWHRSEPTGYEALDPLPLDSGLAWSEEVSSWSPTDPNGVVWILHSAICDSEWLVLPTESDHPIITMVHLRNLSYSHECWFTNWDPEFQFVTGDQYQSWHHGRGCDPSYIRKWYHWTEEWDIVIVVATY